MADELRDLRAKITVKADAVLDVMAKARSIKHGRPVDRSEIVREILHAWALEYIVINNLLDARLRAEGSAGQLGEDS